MRLPWIQVDKAGIAKCRVLAQLLKVTVPHAIGLGTMLWEWAFELAPDGDFSGNVPDVELLAAALEWPAEDASRLVSQLQRVGMIATFPCLRVRGLDRYRAAWAKNQRRNGNPPNSGGGVPATGDTPPGNRPKPERKTETETETETETDSPAERSRDPHPLQVVWNANRVDPMPKWLATSKTRRSHAEQRLKERSLDAWADIVKRIAASDFASGRTGKWTATADWLIGSPSNALKVLEGNYDNKATAADLRKPVAPGVFTENRIVRDF